MSLVTERSLSRMRSAYATGMMDECVLITRTGNTGNYGYDSSSYADGSTVSCLYLPASTKERNEWYATQGGQVFDMDASLYFLRTQTIDNKERVRVTKMHGEALATPLTFEIVAGPVTNHVRTKVAIKLVTDGT